MVLTGHIGGSSKNNFPNKMDTTAFIQARMGSSRFPRKVMQDLAGATMLERVVTRSLLSKQLDAVVIVTSQAQQDDAIYEFCKQKGWACFRGHEDDVLDRYYQAAKTYQSELVLRITADCPLIDPAIIDQMIQVMKKDPSLHYVNNRLPPLSFPRGQEMDLLTFDTLEKIWRLDKNPRWREHVTPYIYNHPDQFRIYTLRNSQDHSTMRWTVDTPQDLDFVRCVYAHFKHANFSYAELLKVLNDNPKWQNLNRSAPGKSLPYIFED